jgi:hypothetical protein
MIDPNLDHVGIVVPRLEPALEALSASLGLEWLPIFDGVMSMHEPHRDTREFHLRIGNSIQYPRLEVIETVPDSPWTLQTEGMLLHHVAFYAGDLAQDSTRVSAPCPIEICGVGPDDEIPKIFTYHLQSGLRFELLERRTIR